MKVCIILKIVVLVMCCLLTVESDECIKSEIVEGRFGEERVLNFPFADLIDKLMVSIVSWHEGSKIKNEINVQDLKKEVKIRYIKNKDSGSEQIIFEDGSPTYGSGRTEIFMTNDTFVLKITRLRKEDAGMYWIEFRSLSLGEKYLIVADKPTIKGQFPPNPVLKPEDNYTTTLQLECDSISTSIGDCHSMYILWYKNGTRMTDLDPNLSQINVTVDHNGGTFTCLATEYRPCYNKLQTTKHYDVLNIEECDNVFESENFTVIPQYAPIGVQLEPDQKEITVNKGEDLKVRCSAKCQPKCTVMWKKDFQGFNVFIKITKSVFENDLEIKNIRSSHEGIYVCLINNDHGEAEKNFTLKVTDTENRVLKSNSAGVFDIKFVIVGGVVVFVILVVVIVVVIVYKKFQKVKNDRHHEVPQESPSEEDETEYEDIDLQQRELLPADSRLIIDDRIYETIDGSNETLNRSNETLNRWNGTLNGSNETLYRSYETLNRSYETLNGSNEPLNRSYETLNRSNGTLNRSYETLNGLNETLNRSYETLNRSNGTLNRSYETLNRLNGTLNRLNGTTDADEETPTDNPMSGDPKKNLKNQRYAVLGFRGIASQYTKLRPTLPSISDNVEPESNEEELS